jgi:hypothetical protein
MKATEITIDQITEAGFDESDAALIRALCEHLDCEPSDLSEASYKHYGELRIFEHGRAEYAVGTDSEADDAWDAFLESYIDECLIPEIKDETLKQYFDTEAWKRDARMDGRGHSLSSYDGNEDEISADDETFYLYRIN